MRIAGDLGWTLCLDELGRADPGEVFIAAVIAFESGQPARTARMLETSCESPALGRAVASALGWLPWQTVRPHIDLLARATPVLGRRAAAAACAVQRQNFSSLFDRLLHDDPVVRARVLRAAGELGRHDLHDPLKAALGDSDESCRFWAAFSLTLFRDPIAHHALCATVDAGGALAERAAILAARAMPVSDALAWQRRLASTNGSRRFAIQAAGAIGDPVSVPWLLDQMSNPPMARVAGEAFTTITGIDLAYHDLDGEWPAGFEVGPNDDPSDANVAMDPDEALPFPDARLVSDWWARNGASLRSGARHLAGKPISVSALQWVLRTGRQRVRAAAALELALLQPSQPLFEVRAPAARQREALGL